MNYIMLAIAVAGLFLSVLTWVRDILSKRNRIDLEVIDYFQNEFLLIFLLRFQNKATISASISKISVKLCGDWYDCKLEQRQISREIPKSIITTLQFPLNILPTSFSQEYVLFFGPKRVSLTPGKEMFFRLHTSRGIMEKSLRLGMRGHYLRYIS